MEDVVIEKDEPKRLEETRSRFTNRLDITPTVMLDLLVWPQNFEPDVAISKSRQVEKTVQDKHKAYSTA